MDGQSPDRDFLNRPVKIVGANVGGNLAEG
jgi:hypothetical protein